MPPNDTRTTDPVETFESSWRAWRERRREQVEQPYGVLSVTALHWLGSEPAALDDLPGLWWATTDAIHVDGGQDAELRLDDTPLDTPSRIWSIADGPLGTVSHNDRQIEPLMLDGEKAVRVRDPQAPARTGFRGVPTFDPDPAWIKDARYLPYDEVAPVKVGSAVPGLHTSRRIRGTVRFEHDGQPLELKVALVGKGLAVPFRDATSGMTTFGLFRSVMIDEPAHDGAVVLDFNRAVNPPCSFTPFGTCPLPPEGNELPFPVEAGERTPVGP